MSKRIALIIDSNTYQDAVLSRLETPETDLHALTITLDDPEIGNFDKVERLVNQPASEIGSHIADLFAWKKPHDLLFLYFLGVGVLDETGALYLATPDTRLDSLAETAIPAAYITEQMDRSFSRQQILLLDCHYSAIDSSENEYRPGSTLMGISTAFKGRGLGRAVVTAGDVIHYLLKRDQVVGQVEASLFSHYLILGLQTGAADGDQDGQIGIGELSEYVYNEVQKQNGVYKPRQWTYREQDRFIIARNPNRFQNSRPKWDLIFGAVMAPVTTIIIGGVADLNTSIGMAGLFLLLYVGLYMVLD